MRPKPFKLPKRVTFQKGTKLIRFDVVRTTTTFQDPKNIGEVCEEIKAIKIHTSLKGVALEDTFFHELAHAFIFVYEHSVTNRRRDLSVRRWHCKPPELKGLLSGFSERFQTLRSAMLLGKASDLQYPCQVKAQSPLLRFLHFANPVRCVRCK